MKRPKPCPICGQNVNPEMTCGAGEPGDESVPSSYTVHRDPVTFGAG